jgi:hypothetical protein
MLAILNNMFIRRVLKTFPKFFYIDVWCTISSYRLGTVLLINYMCKFWRGCAMQFGGSGATSGRQGQWFLHHDNAPSHTSLVVQQFLTTENIPVITQPPYSPVLTPSDFWLFPDVTMGLKETRLQPWRT